MRVYNPRATFEQAEQISKLFEEADQSKKKKKKKSKNTETPHDEEAMSLADLPTDVLLKIFIHVADPHNYTEEARTSNRRYSATKVAALRNLYRLCMVCKRFRSVIHEFHAHLPKPTIGLRLQAPVKRPRNYGGYVVAYIYGPSGERYFSKCVVVTEVPAAIFPAEVTTFLIVKGLVITDALMDMLLSLDLSKVEELFWHDIRGSRATNLVEKMQTLLSKMTSLCSAEFYCTNDFFDPTTLFPRGSNFWRELGWEKTDEKQMSREQVLKQYRKLQKWAAIRGRRQEESTDDRRRVDLRRLAEEDDVLERARAFLDGF